MTDALDGEPPVEVGALRVEQKVDRVVVEIITGLKSDYIKIQNQRNLSKCTITSRKSDQYLLDNEHRSY